MKGEKAKMCRSCGKRPAVQGALGFCEECQEHVYLDPFSRQAKDPRTKKSWPIADLLSGQGLSLK